MPGQRGEVASDLTLHQVADELGLHYMTVYRYVRTGRLPATKRGGTWVVSRGDLEAMADHEPVLDPDETTQSERRERVNYAGRLEDRLVKGDEAGAWGVVEGAMGSALEPEEIYTAVIAPAMASIGERWAAGTLEIEEEHRASTIVQRLVGRLGPRFTRRGRRRGTVVLGAPAGDAHGIPLLLVGDLLRARGFEVIDLGADTPPAAFARTVASTDRLVGVGVCATRPDNAPALAATVDALADVSSAPIILGGYGVGEAETAALEDWLRSGQVRITGSTDEVLESFEVAGETSRAS